jgi:hypothetical protein
MAAQENHRALRDLAVLIGFNPQGQCVYSAQMPLSDYWDGDHPWDDDKEIMKLQLERVRGYLFGSEGELEQEFESVFNVSTGMFVSGWAKDDEGAVEHHAA